MTLNVAELKTETKKLPADRQDRLRQELEAEGHRKAVNRLLEVDEPEKVGA